MINNVKPVSAIEVAELFKRKGLIKTSEWITFSLGSRLPVKQDISDIVNTLKTEIRLYKKEYYGDSEFKETCFYFIWEMITKAIRSDSEKLYKLTGELIPVMDRIIQTNQVLEDIVKVAEKLDQKPKFYMICFYFLILMEGSFKNVLRNLLAMKGIIEGKDVSVTETLGLRFDETIEKEREFQNTLPDKFRQGVHNNLRNSIAHGNFRYYDKEDTIEFWDIWPNTREYSLKPTKLRYDEFSKSLLEVNLFCEIFGFVNLALLAIHDINKHRNH